MQNNTHLFGDFPCNFSLKTNENKVQRKSHVIVCNTEVKKCYWTKKYDMENKISDAV